MEGRLPHIKTQEESPVASKFYSFAPLVHFTFQNTSKMRSCDLLMNIYCVGMVLLSFSSCAVEPSCLMLLYTA